MHLKSLSSVCLRRLVVFFWLTWLTLLRPCSVDTLDIVIGTLVATFVMSRLDSLQKLEKMTRRHSSVMSPVGLLGSVLVWSDVWCENFDGLRQRHAEGTCVENLVFPMNSR